MSSLHIHNYLLKCHIPLTPALMLSPVVICCGGHADHGHCAAPGQVFSAQEANYRR